MLTVDIFRFSPLAYLLITLWLSDLVSDNTGHPPSLWQFTAVHLGEIEPQTVLYILHGVSTIPNRKTGDEQIRVLATLSVYLQFAI